MVNKCAFSKCTFYEALIFSSIILLASKTLIIAAHTAADFDDTILHKLDFEPPDFEQYEVNKFYECNTIEDSVYAKAFHTNHQEKYVCVRLKKKGFEKSTEENKADLSPLALLKSDFKTPSCAYKIESYWSYEICHGRHVRQYHEEREGKKFKFQEYYLGRWNNELNERLQTEWEAQRESGAKQKTIKIDNINYPYFEMEMNNGTQCDITNEPRVTKVLYVCYPQGKYEIYSFKEIATCNYEVIILTSTLCAIPVFHPEKSKTIYIKCFNAHSKTHKPYSLLFQEWNDFVSEIYVPMTKNLDIFTGSHSTANFLSKLKDEKLLTNQLSSSDNADVKKTDADADRHQSSVQEVNEIPVSPVVSDVSPILEFIEGKKCLTGGTGWWKYEFCYGNYVRQFHKDKKSEAVLFLGYFNAPAHRKWLNVNPDKKHNSKSTVLWYHYEKGTRCDRTGLHREVDIKFTCNLSATSSLTSVSMYLLEPKTCHYILVFESPMVCILISYVDEYGMISEADIEKLRMASFTQPPTSVISEETKSSTETVRATTDVSTPPTTSLLENARL